MMKPILIAVAAAALTTSAWAQTGQSDVDSRTDSGSLSAGQKEATPATRGQAENQRQEPQSGASADTEPGGAGTAPNDTTYETSPDGSERVLRKPMTSDPAGAR